MKTKPPISNCCQAPMTVSTADEGTAFYVCDKCQKSCTPEIPFPWDDKDEARFYEPKPSADKEMKIKLQLVTFPTKRVKVKCDIHGVQKVVSIPSGGVACEKCVASEITLPPVKERPCNDYDGQGKSTCGFDCPVHQPKRKKKGKHRYKWSFHCAKCFSKFMKMEWKKIGNFDLELQGQFGRKSGQT